MKKLFIASKNQGKITEIKSYLKDMEYEVFSLLDTHKIPDIKETGTTFEENALIKAKAVYNIVKIPVLADDSGLEVDFLNGAPGVYSARFAGETAGTVVSATDEKNNAKLLAELGDIALNERTARFKCVIVLYDGVSERYFDGICEGIINTAPKGDKGFGYDPLFIPNGFSETYAELGLNVKNKISHRGKALLSLKKFLELEERL